MTPVQKGLVLTLGAAEMALTTVAVVDLARRPVTRMHGRKAWWALALAVQPVGPVAYLWVHRDA